MLNSDIDPTILNLFEFKPRKGDIKKIEIIIATITCIHEDGFDKTTFESISKRVGTNRSHIKYYFKSKDEILLEVIKYIAATYQQLSMNELSKSKKGIDTLNKYIDAYFIWAKQHPEQVSVMLLLFYLCTYNPFYKKINQQVRDGGVDRISFILKSELNLNHTPNKRKVLARGIQALLSNAIVEVYTFEDHSSFKNKEKDARELIMKLINNSKI